MDSRMYERNIILAEKEDLFFKEVIFDFSQAETTMVIPNPTPTPPSPIPTPSPDPVIIHIPNPLGYEIGKVFMVHSVDELVKVEAYPTTDRAVMFNAWITKNIVYKTVKTDYNLTGNIGTGFIDDYGYPTVSGPMFYMTKLINFGGNIILDLPAGEMLREDDKIEVLSAKIVGTHNKLYNKEPIYKSNGSYFGPTESSILDENFNLYNKLIEKMCLKIKVRVIRKITLNPQTN